MLYADSMELLTQGQQHLRRCVLSRARTHAHLLTHTYARDRRPTDPARDRSIGLIDRRVARRWHAYCVRIACVHA